MVDTRLPLLVFFSGFLSGFMVAGMMWNGTLFHGVLNLFFMALGSILLHVYTGASQAPRATVASQAPCTYTALRKHKEPRFLPLPECSWG